MFSKQQGRFHTVPWLLGGSLGAAGEGAASGPRNQCLEAEPRPVTRMRHKW